MEWLSREASLSAAPVPDVALLEQAVAANPAAAPLHGRLAAAHFARQDFAGAAASFAEAERLDPAGFRAWEPFAASLVRIGAYAEALAACDRALDRGAGDGLRHYRGTALRRLGRREEGRADLERALVSGDRQFHTLKALLRPMSAKPDGGPLLDYCDALPPAYRRCAGANAYRAIALSRLGREEEANAMVDLDRHVVLDRFEPPAEFGGIEAFNRLLAEEILRDPPPGAKRDGFRHQLCPPSRREPRLRRTVRLHPLQDRSLCRAAGGVRPSGDTGPSPRRRIAGPRHRRAAPRGHQWRAYPCRQLHLDGLLCRRPARSAGCRRRSRRAGDGQVQRQYAGLSGVLGQAG
jgi:tetratricopeptide (TPR) repeat protein